MKFRDKRGEMLLCFYKFTHNFTRDGALEYEIKMDSARQQQEYQRQILRNQAEALELQKEALKAQKRRDFRDSLDLDMDTTNCRQDGLGGFRCTSY